MLLTEERHDKSGPATKIAKDRGCDVVVHSDMAVLCGGGWVEEEEEEESVSVTLSDSATPLSEVFILETELEAFRREKLKDLSQNCPPI